MPIPCGDPSFPPGVIGVASSFLGRYREFDMDLARVKAPPGSVVEWRMGVNVAHHYNNMIRTMINDPKFQWVWILGDDHVFRPDTLMNLLSRGVDMVTPLCLRRSEPYETVLHTCAEDGYRLVRLENIAHERGLLDITAYVVGNAGTLLSRRLCEAMEDPWHVCGQTNPEYIGSDLYFCEKVRKYGFKSYLDLETTIGHLTTAAVWPVRNGDGKYHPQVIGPGAKRSLAEMVPEDKAIDWITIFNDYRKNYDTLPFENHVKLYEIISKFFPSQEQYNLDAVNSWIETLPKPVRILEIGGWKGELARKILETHGERITSWMNHDICNEAIIEGYKGDKYISIPLRGFLSFTQGMCETDALLMSHSLEHMKFREFESFMNGIKQKEYPIRHIYLDVPIAEKDRDVNWENYSGTHVLDVGWETIEALIFSHGYLKTSHNGNIRCFSREKNA